MGSIRYFLGRTLQLIGLATISAVAMMLEHLGESEAARRVDAAVALCLQEGQVLTPDLGGKATTEDVTEAVCRSLLGANE